MLFRTRDLLVRQRTQTINTLRGHLAEFGVVAAQGPAHVDRLAPALADPDSNLPEAVRELGRLLLEQILAFTLDEVARLHEHAPRAAGGIEDYAVIGRDHVDDGLDDGGRGGRRGQGRTALAQPRPPSGA